MYGKLVITSADISWLKELEADLWPPKDERTHSEKMVDRIKGVEPKFKKPRERLTSKEVLRIFKTIPDLAVEPISYGLFGGIALRIYEHEQYMGTGPEYLVCITDKHLPDPTRASWHKTLLGRVYESAGKQPGGIRDDAWDLFVRYAKADRNMRWLTQYKLTLPRDRVHYEY